MQLRTFVYVDLNTQADTHIGTIKMKYLVKVMALTKRNIINNKQQQQNMQTKSKYSTTKPNVFASLKYVCTHTLRCE